MNYNIIYKPEVTGTKMVRRPVTGRVEFEEMKKIIGIVIAALLISGISGIGTWAYFADNENSTGNTFAAGTLDLKTNDQDGVSQTLLATNFQPGETIGPETIILKNSGSLDASSLDIVFSYEERDGTTNPADRTADDTAAVIEITLLKYDGAGLLSGISDLNENGYRDIYDLKNADLTGQSGITSLSSKDFEITVRSRSGISGEFQSDGIVITMTFTLNQ